MSKYSRIAIVSSFFCLWINSYFSINFQIFLGFLFIFSFGILHGANDLVLISNLNVDEKKISFKKILFSYVLIVLFGAFSFYFFSKIALIVFILFSGYHFGEQQFSKIDCTNKVLLHSFQMSYGLLVLFMLFYFHQHEVIKIVAEITSYKLDPKMIIVLFGIICCIFFINFIYLFISYIIVRMQLLQELFYLLVFAIIFMCSNLIWGFAIYFVFWHSIPSIIDQIGFLYGGYSHNNFFKYFKSAFVYWLASLISLVLLYYFLKDFKLFNSLFFSFLAAITFPHVLVIVQMLNKKK